MRKPLTCLTISLIVSCSTFSIAQEDNWKTYVNNMSGIEFKYPGTYILEENRTPEGRLSAASLGIKNDKDTDWIIDISSGEAQEWIKEVSGDRQNIPVITRSATPANEFIGIIARLHCATNSRACIDLIQWVPFNTANGFRAYEFYIKEAEGSKGPVFGIDISSDDFLRVLYITPRNGDSAGLTDDLRGIVDSVKILNKDW